MLIAAWEYVVQNPALFRAALVQHIPLSGVSLAIAIVVAVPTGLLVSRAPKIARLAMNAADTVRTIPSLAVLAITLPFLGIGFLPSIVALTVLALPPILTNTYIGLRQVDADVIESAAGMGMTVAQTLRRIQVPIAMPVILAGVRTAAVQVVAGATLAAFIGGGGLGDFITTGIGMMQPEMLL